MLSLSNQSRIFIHALPTDMRKSFDGLCGIVKGEFHKDVLEGDYFVPSDSPSGVSGVRFLPDTLVSIHPVTEGSVH